MKDVGYSGELPGVRECAPGTEKGSGEWREILENLQRVTSNYENNQKNRDVILCTLSIFKTSPPFSTWGTLSHNGQLPAVTFLLHSLAVHKITSPQCLSA